MTNARSRSVLSGSDEKKNNLRRKIKSCVMFEVEKII